jgi:hypothetical protein
MMGCSPCHRQSYEKVDRIRSLWSPYPSSASYIVRPKDIR